MIFVNELTPTAERPRTIIEPFVKILAPFAPHVAEEMWEKLGHTKSLAYEPWPAYDPQWIVDDEVTVVVQVNGKLRDKLTVAKGTDKSVLESRSRELVAKWLDGKSVVKCIVVPDKLVNLVVK